jgi:hypothetical protein
MQEEDCRINQARPNHKGEGILELERELRGFVPEQQHRQKSARPATNGTDCSEVEITNPIAARTTPNCLSCGLPRFLQQRHRHAVCLVGELPNQLGSFLVQGSLKGAVSDSHPELHLLASVSHH